MNTNDATPDAAPAPDVQAIPAMLTATIGQIRFARDYTLGLLQATDQQFWYQIPDGLPTNIAWQVGHLAVSQYGLLMFRIRGREPEDLDLIPGRFRKAYGRGSKPNADPAKQPTPAELTERLNEVMTRGIAVLESVAPESLLDPIDMPYAAYPNKLGAILFCPLHEHIHAGQIGLLRRALGLDPVR